VDTEQASFHVEEYKQIREEVTTMITKTEQLLQYCVVVSAAVFAWLATQAVGLNELGKLCTKLPVDGPLAVRIWWAPTAAVLVVGLLGGGRFVRVKEMGQYLRKLEDALGDPSLGWEKFLAAKPITVSVVTVAAWIGILFCTCYIAWQMQEVVPSLRACLLKTP
jgi:hypothetical protein